MKLIEMTVNGFLNEVDSPSPAPGGGSVSALAVAEGISLIRMVAQLTIGKKKFQALDEKIKLDYLSRMKMLEELKLQATQLIDADTEAFNTIMKAYQCPKTCDLEMAVRSKAIEQATIKATQVPMDTASIALKAMELALPMFENANRSATSDFGVGIKMLEAGMIGAVLNVRTNMCGFTDSNLSKQYLSQAEAIEKKGIEMAAGALEKVNQVWK